MGAGHLYRIYDPHAGDVAGAIGAYTSGLTALQGSDSAAGKPQREQTSPNPVLEAALLSNRAGCYHSLEDWNRSVCDSESVVALRPNWARGHYRLGMALFGRKQFELAHAAADRAEKLDPASENTALKWVLNFVVHLVRGFAKARR
eukprot:SAG31_NODE_7745_length_1605_cov_1.529216_1_plen_146_part_00